MIDNLESNYDCAQAGADLHSLKEELNQLASQGGSGKEHQEQLNRIENQIRFIENKCSIHHSHS
ncbi:DUF2524 domain-containing protein [Paenibacillus hexagrammi]|uniref:DUF2524 domain-containing protein n=1 Tax=Paenibacillus hexagrammi TaxID=2908839 RepID=A0ABY3SEI0_9BACL|nr:DUF2524 domain-containing protein [Paenibacillus sp. YPD9-1]UJF31644.1 DUF2524 domain-containing protein [Paenibacillus sp. YPD9-1]